MEKATWDVKVQFEQYKNQNVFDCLIAESLLVQGRSVGEMAAVLKKYAVTTLEDLAKKQKEALRLYPKMEKLFYEVEMPLARVLYDMESVGITLDRDELKKTGDEIKEKILILQSSILKEVGSEINLASPMQVGRFLAEKAGVPLSKTKTGQYATGENELLKFKDQFPIIAQILQLRELSKLVSTYTDSLIEKVDSEDRIHTTYSQVSVNTGRLSSSNPNMQNIPVGSEYGLKIKSCFVASEGHTLLSFDYSQQELRILAHLAKEEKMIAAFASNQDIHTLTASQLFTVDYKDVTKKQRSIAKTINFGIIYGMSSYGMSDGLQISVEEAGLFIDNFYATFPNIQKFYATYLSDGFKNDFVETMLGRRRYVRQYPEQKFLDNNTKRVLMNYPIQGTAAELMKMAMVKINHEVLAVRNDIRLLLQIHDDLVFEIQDLAIDSGEIEEIKDIMCQICPLSVPMEVDVKIGKRWGEMEKFT